MRRIRDFIFAMCALGLISGCTPDQIDWWLNAPPDQRDAATEYVVREAAAEFGVDPDLMLRIQRCEGSVPWARNRSTASGLFQHIERYWPGRAAAVGADGAPWWDPQANARAAAWMMANGGTAPWRASSRCW
jgi:hypothetical protein